MNNSAIRMLTINQAAEKVPGLTRYRIREMCIQGELPCLMAGRKYLICEQVLLDTVMQPATGAVQPDADPIRRLDT